MLCCHSSTLTDVQTNRDNIAAELQKQQLENVLLLLSEVETNSVGPVAVYGCVPVAMHATLIGRGLPFNRV